jgi:hypothetical protein
MSNREERAKKLIEEGVDPQSVEDAMKMGDMLEEIVAKHVPADIPVLKVLERYGMMGMVLPISRTTLLALAAILGTRAFPCTLEKKELLDLIGEIYDAVATLPTAQKVNQDYAINNLQAKTGGVMMAEGSKLLN